jgi:hypothetical protein
MPVPVLSTTAATRYISTAISMGYYCRYGAAARSALDPGERRGGVPDRQIRDTTCSSTSIRGSPLATQSQHSTRQVRARTARVTVMRVPSASDLLDGAVHCAGERAALRQKRHCGSPEVQGGNTTRRSSRVGALRRCDDRVKQEGTGG